MLNEARDTGEPGFTPYLDLHRVKVSRFPDGGGEAVCYRQRFRVYSDSELREKAKRMANGGGSYKRTEKKDLPELERAAKDLDNIDRACRRASRAVRHYVRRLEADHLLTVTYRENMQDFERAKSDWRAFVRLVHVKYPEWRYVVITELQQRGAIHFHGAVVGYQDVSWLRRCWWRVVGQGMGNIDVKGPPKRFAEGGGKTWKASKLAGYLTKYMSKGFNISLHHAHRYWASLGLPPVKVSAWYLEARDFSEAIRLTYSLVGGGEGASVRQWLHESADFYFVSSDIPPGPPF